jgi:hypothetical protein
MKSGMLTAKERKRMLDIGARYVEEGAPHSWFIEAYEGDEGDVDAVYSNLVEEGLLQQIGPGNVFHITATGRDWVKAHSADLMKQP